MAASTSARGSPAAPKKPSIPARAEGLDHRHRADPLGHGAADVRVGADHGQRQKVDRRDSPAGRRKRPCADQDVGCSCRYGFAARSDKKEGTGASSTAGPFVARAGMIRLETVLLLQSANRPGRYGLQTTRTSISSMTALRRRGAGGQADAGRYCFNSSRGRSAAVSTCSTGVPWPATTCASRRVLLLS